MAANRFVRNFVLLPMSKLYGFGMSVRDLMFRWKILKQRKFDVPVICVGNICAGGTGKTPHTEYIIKLLKHNYHIGMVSRGYKRTTKGFVLATNRSTPLDIGDEPYQVYQKFGREVSVAVCEDRCEGIEKLLEIDPKINLIVLDDAFQHRYVQPTISVVLTEFNKPVYLDKLLPLGRLRESPKAIYRADIVVVTKCPDRLNPIEYRILKNNLDLYPYQHLFFSRFDYKGLRPVFPESVIEVPDLNWYSSQDTLLLVSGVANPRPLVSRLKTYGAKVRVKIFPDHHNFTRKDLDVIVARFNEIQARNKIIITTEKDAVRMANNPYFPEELKSMIFYQAIEVEFDAYTEGNFDYVLKKMIVERTNAQS